MNPVEAYLQQPATHRLYSEGLKLFQAYGLNAYPQAWQKLSAGPFGQNKEELEGILRRIAQQPLPEVAPAPPPKVTVHAVPAPQSPEEPVNLEYDVLKKLRHHRQRRMQLSQSFHDCETDDDRAHVCDLIQAENDALRQLDGELAYIRRFGKKPPEPEPETIELPNDDEALATMQNRLRSRILKVEKRIEFLVDLPEKDRRRAKIPAQQNKLRDLQTRVDLIVEKRNKLKHAQS